MATMHRLHLNALSFGLVKQGVKTIEARLYDERRQRIGIGDEITFISRDDNQTIVVTVSKLHRASTFHELFAQIDPIRFGGESALENEKAIEQYYSYSDQQQYGVLGIEFVAKK